MSDPITSLSLALNIIALTEIGIKVLRLGYKLYKPTDDSQGDLHQFEIYALQIKDLNGKFESTITAESADDTSARKLRRHIETSDGLVCEVLSIVRSLKLPPKPSLLRVSRCVCRTLYRLPKVNDILQRLERLQHLNNDFLVALTL